MLLVTVRLEVGLVRVQKHTRLSIVVAPTVLIRWIATWIRKNVRTRDSMMAAMVEVRGRDGRQ